jgi:hypothetical protein
MSLSKPTIIKSESRKKRFGRGLRELFGKKTNSRILASNSSRSLHNSEVGSIQKYTDKPSITVEESTLQVVESVDVGASSNLQGSLHASIAQSRQSLTSRQSKGSFKSNHTSPYNE